MSMIEGCIRKSREAGAVYWLNKFEVRNEQFHGIEVRTFTGRRTAMAFRTSGYNFLKYTVVFKNLFQGSVTHRLSRHTMCY